jgi:hypothetical protein
MLWLVWATGCGEDPVELPGPEASVEEAPAFPPAAPDSGVQVVVKGKRLMPGEEIEMCHYVNVGNDDTVWVDHMELIAAPGLHHSIVSRISEEREPSSSECFGFPNDLGNEIPLPLFATSTQVDRGVIDLPDHVGIELGARQQLIVNYHYLNATSEPIKPEIYLNLHYTEPEKVRSRAGFYTFTNVGDIAIPPRGKQRITMTCPFLEPAALVSTTPHMHELGSYFEVKHWDGESNGPVLYELSGWFDPETKIFDPPIILGEGHGLTFTCEWESDRDQTTWFGESAEHEMCFVFGYFYPASIDVIGVDGFGCEVVENVITPAQD